MLQEYNINDTVVTRQPTETSMGDGAILRGFRYQSADADKDRRRNSSAITTPLLCLATDLGNRREYHRFGLALASQEDATQRIYTLDLRGRGQSDSLGVPTSDVTTDADDLISFCDANNLHHIDIVVSGFSALTLFLACIKRPGLVRKLVLNDAAPEFDAVGIARRNALLQRVGRPSSWEDGAKQMETLKSEEFPYFGDDDWLDMAKQRWRDHKGKPVADIAKGLVRWSNLADYDSQQPHWWREFAIFNKRPVLLIQGEFSGLITDKIVKRTARRHRYLKVVVAKGQGHVPQLERGHMTGHVLDFLRQE